MKLRDLLWSPVKERETWALTLVRVTGNLLRWIVGLPAIIAILIAIGLAINSWYSGRPVELDTIKGVSIGMSPDQVTVAKGNPSNRTGPSIRTDGTYKSSMEYGGLLVLFEGPVETDLSVWRVCETDPSPYASYNGISKFDSEADVLKQLGKSDQEQVREDKLGKALVFYRWNMVVHLKADSTTGICIGAGGK